LIESLDLSPSNQYILVSESPSCCFFLDLMYVCPIHAISFGLQSHVLCISIAYRIMEYYISLCLQKSSFNIFCGPITKIYTKQVWFSTVITLRLKLRICGLFKVNHPTLDSVLLSVTSYNYRRLAAERRALPSVKGNVSEQE
jgi:hypothetical protein